MSDLSDQLETDFGTAILEELTGETLTRKSQPVRLFDQSNRTAERFYFDDGNGKPFIQNYQEGRRWYPINAYSEANGIDWKTALRQLSARYLGDTTLRGSRSTTQRIRPLVAAAPPQPVSYHDPALVASTMGCYDRNDFVIYLRRLLGVPVADELLLKFQVGTGLHWHIAPEWPRSTVFWQICEQGHVRAGKVMAYSGAIGRRLKDKKTGQDRPYWVHEILSMRDFHYQQCLFGLHQLPHYPDTKPIAIVESEKSAVIATAFMPGFIWLATGGLGNLTADKFKVLAGRNVTLFPDLSKPQLGQPSAFEQWVNKAPELRRVGCSVTVSRMLEGKATTLERDAGYDIVDFLTRHRCPVSGRVLTESDGYAKLWGCESINNTPTIREQSVQDCQQKYGLNQTNPRQYRPAPVNPLIVRTLAEWGANPGSICRPDESQIERLVVN